MHVAPDRPTRVAADLLESATVEGQRQSRSAKQQLDHWTRVGRAVSTGPSAARRRVEAALSGQLALAELTGEERVVVDAELDAAISETAARTSFGRVLHERGITTVALNTDGVLTRYHPDGSTSPLA
jgi:hypothetical protein